TPREGGRRCGRVRCKHSWPDSLNVRRPMGAAGSYTLAALLPMGRRGHCCAPDRTRRSSGAGRRTREAALLRDDEVLSEDLRTRHLVEEPLDPVDDRRRDAVRLVDHELAVVVV